MKQTTVYLTEEQREAVRALSVQLSMRQSVLIRRGVDWAIDWARDRLEVLALGEQALEREDMRDETQTERK